MARLTELGWYLRRPTLYRRLARRLFRRGSFRRLPEWQSRYSKLPSTEWCEEHEVPGDDVLSRLGLDPELISVRRAHPEVFREAERVEDRCPVEMGGAGHLDLLYTLCVSTAVRRVVETGVAFGWSALAVLLALERTDGRLISIDMPYPLRGNDPYVGSVVPDDIRDRWTLVRKPDRDGLEPALRTFGTIDLFHHDSDKSYLGRMYAYQQSWGHLADGGILLSDDIEDNFAFRDFCSIAAVDPLVTRKPGGRFVGIISRRSG